MRITPLVPQLQHLLELRVGGRERHPMPGGELGIPYRWTVQEQLKVFFPPLKGGLMFCKDGCLWRLGPGYTDSSMMSWSQKPTALDQLLLSIVPFPEESVLGSKFPSPGNIVSESAAISKLKWSSSQLTRAVRPCGLSTSSWYMRVCTIHAPTVSFSFCFRFLLVYWPHTKVPTGRGLPVRGGVWWPMFVPPFQGVSPFRVGCSTPK